MPFAKNLAYSSKVAGRRRGKRTAPLFFYLAVAVIFSGGAVRPAWGNEKTTPSSTGQEIEKKAGTETAPKPSLSAQNKDENAYEEKQSPRDLNAAAGQLPVDEALKQTPPESGESAEAEKQKEVAKEEEDELVCVIETVPWEESEDRAVLTLEGEGSFLPAARVFSDQGGLLIRWRPESPVIVKEKKRIFTGGTLLQEIVFRENTELTKKFGLEAPYYAIEEITLRFSAPVIFNSVREEGKEVLEFNRVKKQTAFAPAEEAHKEVNLPFNERPRAPRDILGSFYERKAQYEDYVLGGDSATENLTKLRSERESKKGLFDGKRGFPEDMGPVFKEAYPFFGTTEYWRKHIRAVLSQTFGYFSDYDGPYGAWGGVKTGKGAGTGEPHLSISYTRQGVVDTAVAYQTQKNFPVGKLVHFGDGPYSQIISLGGGYFPLRRYSVYTQNKISFFSGKNIDSTSSSTSAGASTGLVRQKNASYRITHAAGLNYRLTRKLQWQGGIGLERSWASFPVGSKMHMAVGFLNTSLHYAFSKRTSMKMEYGYNNDLVNTGAGGSDGDGGTSTPGGDGSIIETKTKIEQTVNVAVKHQFSDKVIWSGGLEEAILGGGGDIGKFGGQTSLTYRWTKDDLLTFKYSNGIVRDDTAILTGRQLDTGARGLDATLSREEILGFSFNHTLRQSGSVAKTSFLFSADYRRILPLSGVYGQQSTKNSGFSLQTTVRRKLRRGLTWLELTYRFSTFRSRGEGEAAVNNVSLGEHAVFLKIANYFGEWEEMT